MKKENIRNAVIAMVIGFAVVGNLNIEGFKAVIGGFAIAGAAWYLLVGTDPMYGRNKK